MKARCFLILFAIMIMSSPISYASVLTATCNNFEGIRIEYFLNNNIGLQNKQFIVQKDKLSGELKLIWDIKKESALFTSQDSVLAGGKVNQTEVISLLQDEKQITFVGVLYGAPILFTLYPEEKVAFYSWHTSQSIAGNGIKSIDLYAKCDINIK
jgi:hypothetical protein